MKADIISPTTDSALPPRTPPEQARMQGHFAYDKPTSQNTIMLFIDHQIGLMAGIRDFSSLAEYRSNIVVPDPFGMVK